MLKPVPLHSLAGKEFVPQAVIDYPMSFFEEKLRMPAVHEQDDLDEYEAIALIIDDGGVLVELKHYAGYPENTTTIYLSDFINNVAQISDTIGIVAGELEIPRERIVWQRSDNPDF